MRIHKYYKRDVAMVFCTECVHPIAYVCLVIGDKAEAPFTTAYVGVELQIPPQLVKYDGRNVVCCPNCQTGHLVFWDQRLAENPTYNPYSLGHQVTDEDEQILIDWLNGNDPLRH